MNTAQPLCQAGICSQTSDPVSGTQANSANPTTQPQNTGSSSTTTPNNSANPTTQPQNTGSSSTTTPTNIVDPPTKSLTFTNTFTTTKIPVLSHKFSNSFVVGSDRFRFIKSFWTSSDVAAAANGGQDTPCPASGQGFIGPIGLVTSPFNIEVDRDEGYATLAIILQYQGVVTLTGITAGLKLPTGFEAQLPIENDRNNYNIALSNNFGTIKPGDAVTLCFPLNVLKTATPQLPVLGPLALHFLRPDEKDIADSIDAQQIIAFMRKLVIANGQNMTTFSKNLNSPNSPTTTLNFSNEFDRQIPFQYIDQVIPVIWKVTGREILDVSLPFPVVKGPCVFSPCVLAPNNPDNGVIVPPYTPPPPPITTTTTTTKSDNTTTTKTQAGTGTPSQTTNGTVTPPYTAPPGPGNDPPTSAASSSSSSKPLASSSASSSSSSNGEATKSIPGQLIVNPITMLFTNEGDVTIHDLVATVSTNVSSLVGPSAVARTFPLGIQHTHVYHIFDIPAGSTAKETVWVRTAISCAAIEPLDVSYFYNNAIGQRIFQEQSLTLQIQQPANLTQACPLAAAGPAPGAGSNGASQGLGFYGAPGTQVIQNIVPPYTAPPKPGAP